MRSNESYMDSPKKPSLVRRGFVIALSLGLLSCFVALVVPNSMRSMRSSKSTQVLTDLRMLDAAIDRYVLENNGGVSQNNFQGSQGSTPAETISSLKLQPLPNTKGLLEQMERPPVVIMSSSKSYVLPGAVGVETLFQKEDVKRPVIMSSSKSGAVITPGTAEAWGDELSRIINRPQSPPQTPAK